jgi:hypothetical protein
MVFRQPEANVAFYKYNKHVVSIDLPVFDSIQKPGDKATHSGIYRCEGCGKEIAAVHLAQLPPQNHHKHSSGQGDIRWRLIVWA